MTLCVAGQVALSYYR